ncbi:MAG TPA: hypothetical protein VGR89_08745 [Puia sp.]|nr:hypothetical protein [Puia sp.]
MNARTFLLHFIIAVPFFIAADYLAMSIHFMEARTFGAELTKSLVVGLLYASVMTYYSSKKRKRRMTKQS